MAERPFQIDADFKPLFATPNHPSYPSGHSSISNATGGVLNYLFPANSADVIAAIHEAGEARIWGGIHFRSDIIGGEKLGGEVANAVIEYAKADGSG
jgi:membrane-associated phospholipid phosphatase